uniref:Uncharacterized protein n=1 Tax=Quercus lobata TaxID=97700 RepID=A0A7N2LP99_QUELO
MPSCGLDILEQKVVKPLQMLFLENTIQEEDYLLTWYQADYVDKVPLTSLQLRPDDSKGYPAMASKLVHFAINICLGLGIVDSNGNAVLPSGSHTIIVGDHQIVHPIQLTYY